MHIPLRNLCFIIASFKFSFINERNFEREIGKIKRGMYISQERRKNSQEGLKD